jgi:hypothetical protein
MPYLAGAHGRLRHREVLLEAGIPITLNVPRRSVGQALWRGFRACSRNRAIRRTAVADTCASLPTSARGSRPRESLSTRSLARACSAICAVGLDIGSATRNVLSESFGSKLCRYERRSTTRRYRIFRRFCDSGPARPRLPSTRHTCGIWRFEWYSPRRIYSRPPRLAPRPLNPQPGSIEQQQNRSQGVGLQFARRVETDGDRVQEAT